MKNVLLMPCLSIRKQGFLKKNLELQMKSSDLCFLVADGIIKLPAFGEKEYYL